VKAVNRNSKICSLGLLLCIGSLISACQPFPQKVQAAVIPVISSSSLDTSTPEIPVGIPGPSPTKKAVPTLVFTPTPEPTRILHATLPPNPPGEDLEKCEAQGNLAFEEQTLELINLERQKRNLPPLLMNHLLVMAARVHSADMACRNYFNHYGIDGSSPFDRMKATGYQMSYAGENIYAGPGENNTPAVAVRLWMNSSTHRNTILNPNYTEAGVGYYFYKPATYDGYFTMDFASPVEVVEQPREDRIN
jgi:uncharacterized protein YkwD